MPLGTGTILACFQAEGKTPVEIERLHRDINGEEMLYSSSAFQHFSRDPITSNGLSGIKINKKVKNNILCAKQFFCHGQFTLFKDSNFPAQSLFCKAGKL